MSEANGGPTVVVVTAGEGAASEGGEGGEVQIASAVEEGAGAAVQIAQIEADRDVTIAAIEADTHIEGRELSIEESRVFAENLVNSELEQCRLKIAELEGLNTGLTLELATRPPLILAPSSEPPLNPEPPPESVVEDGQKESPVEAVAEAPEPPPKKRKPHRWI